MTAAPNEEEMKDRIDRSFEDYRKSGLALMATVIALSSGGLAGLLQIPGAKSIALLYLVPISLAVLQQLAHYLGTKANAHSDFQRLYQTPDADERAAMEARIGGTIYYMHANLHFGVSDVLSVLACVSLSLVTLFPLIILSQPLIWAAVIGSIVIVAAYWIWKWRVVEEKISKIEW